MIFQIAGITFLLELDGLRHPLQEGAFQLFKPVSENIDVKIRIKCYDPVDSRSSLFNDRDKEFILRSVEFPGQWLGKTILQSTEVYTIIQSCLDQPENAFIDLRWNKARVFNFNRREVTFLYPPGYRRNLSRAVLFAGLRNLCAAFFPLYSAVGIHCASVIRDGAAALFLAKDGGGKTSVASLADPVSILNDDHVVLQQENNRVYAHGTPFGTMSNGPLKARLGGLFLIEKAEAFSLVPLNYLDVIQHIWDEHFYTWFQIPKQLRITAHDVIYQACRQVPCYKMCFPKDYVDWDAIDAAMLK